ncbi:MAG: hypothetical protein CVU89_06935 [Firmicutes bacterium HGW-Firmicutes-14]|nr:MAG: hypothetical protein CVU89_06935 [Firmicutes bacterium HGW-Firmicutes-14]
MFTGISLFIILAIVAYLVILPLVRRDSRYDLMLPDPMLSDPDISDSVLSDPVLPEENPGDTWDDKQGDTPKGDLENIKEAIFTTINEIEFDYAMKKLSDDDYHVLKEQYKQKALELLHREDESELETEALPLTALTTAEADIEEEIERELQALRQSRSATEKS